MGFYEQKWGFENYGMLNMRLMTLRHGRKVPAVKYFDFYMCTLSITPRFRHPPPQVPRFRVPRLARCGGKGSGGSEVPGSAPPESGGGG